MTIMESVKLDEKMRQSDILFISLQRNVPLMLKGHCQFQKKKNRRL